MKHVSYSSGNHRNTANGASLHTVGRRRARKNIPRSHCERWLLAAMPAKTKFKLSSKKHEYSLGFPWLTHFCVMCTHMCAFGWNLLPVDCMSFKCRRQRNISLLQVAHGSLNGDSFKIDIYSSKHCPAAEKTSPWGSRAPTSSQNSAAHRIKTAVSAAFVFSIGESPEPTMV